MTPALPLLAPAFFALVGIFYMNRDLPRGSTLLRLGEYAGLAAMVVSLGALGLLIRDGSRTSGLLGAANMGFSARIDTVSVTMLMLVSFIGWVVMRFAVTYTDGEKNQAQFLGWLSFGLASVLLLVTAGNLIQLIIGWGAVGLCVNRLLLTYSERAAAQRAARKKALCSMASDGGLILGAFALAAAYGTADIQTIIEAARAGEGGGAAILAAGLLAISALFKSAQVPTHGWLTEVMEAPTPVSALLHAGVVNAGGFLLIRFADVMLLAPGVLSVLVILGGFSALFGGLVMLTQPSVKTSLAWSTVAQMGFMILQCGLALFPAGAAAHRGAFALQGACLPCVGRCGATGGVDPAARSRGDPEWQGSSQGVCLCAGDLRHFGPAAGYRRQVSTGNCAGCSAGDGSGLSAGPRSGGSRARGADAAHGGLFGGDHAELFCAAIHRDLADDGRAARNPGPRTAAMGADGADHPELRHGGLGTGNVPELGQPSGRPRPSGASIERILPQRGV